MKFRNAHEHIIIFYIFEEAYRVAKIEKAAKKNHVSIAFVEVNSLIFDIDLVKNGIPIKKNVRNIGYFLGSFTKYDYLVDILQKWIILPQFTSHHLSDKFDFFTFCIQNEINTPATTLITTHLSLNKAIESVGGFPCVIKKTTGSCGKFVEIAKTKKDCLRFIIGASKKNFRENAIYPRRSVFILQKLIPESKGADYRALCIENNVLGVIKRSSTNNSFKANISLGGTAQIIEDAYEIKEISKNIMKKSNLFIAGIDFIKGKNGYYAIEANTSPQFEGFEKATGIDVADIIIKKLLTRTQ